MSSKMPDGTTVPDEIKKRMEALGYNVSAKLLCASNYGVPQQRYRYLIIGVSSEYEPFDFAEIDNLVSTNHIPSSTNDTDEKLLLGSILQGIDKLPDNEFWAYSATTQNTVELIRTFALMVKVLIRFFKILSKRRFAFLCI